MIAGYDYDAPISFHQEYGWLNSGQFPADCIADCCAPGSVDEAVAYWVKRLKLTEAIAPVRQKAEAYLKEYGAWDDLATVEIGVLAGRILWVACCDIAERDGGWNGLVN
jgi:hypothetical protein